MRGGVRAGRPRPLPDADDPDSALDALSAEELRAFVRDSLAALEDEPRGVLLDALVARAARGSAGWRPSGPSGRAVAEIRRFAQAARHVGYANPADVDTRLRQGSNAFLAGEHAAARAVFEALLPSIADAEIDLGQHELVDEVLTIDVRACAAQYVASVYLTTPIGDRAQAVGGALDAVQGIAVFSAPLEEMRRAATGPLPQLEAFLPRWVERLEREPYADDDWGRARDRWLREAVLRLEGVAGLERIARKTRRPEALQAWCEALVARREWAEALRAHDDAAALAGGPEWRGAFLDGAALAARELGRRDAAARLEAAWLGAPSLVRLLRWLGAGGPSGRALVRRARAARARCPAQAGRQLGLLRLLTGNFRAAARQLAEAPGLGWSSEDHPGHVLFPAFAGLLAGGTTAAVSAELLAGLHERPNYPWDVERGDDEDEGPMLATPSIAEIIQRMPSATRPNPRGRDAVLAAMRVAATRRVEGLLGNKRRRHYGHAALLVACCLALAPGVRRRKASAEWVAELRRRYARFHAFQAECRRALALVAQ